MKNIKLALLAIAATLFGSILPNTDTFEAIKSFTKNEESEARKIIGRIQHSAPILGNNVLLSGGQGLGGSFFVKYITEKVDGILIELDGSENPKKLIESAQKDNVQELVFFVKDLDNATLDNPKFVSMIKILSRMENCYLFAITNKATTLPGAVTNIFEKIITMPTTTSTVVNQALLEKLLGINFFSQEEYSTLGALTEGLSRKDIFNFVCQAITEIAMDRVETPSWTEKIFRQEPNLGCNSTMGSCEKINKLKTINKSQLLIKLSEILQTRPNKEKNSLSVQTKSITTISGEKAASLGIPQKKRFPSRTENAKSVGKYVLSKTISGASSATTATKDAVWNNPKTTIGILLLCLLGYKNKTVLSFLKSMHDKMPSWATMKKGAAGLAGAFGLQSLLPIAQAQASTAPAEDDYSDMPPLENPESSDMPPLENPKSSEEEISQPFLPGHHNPANIRPKQFQAIGNQPFVWMPRVQEVKTTPQILSPGYQKTITHATNPAKGGDSDLLTTLLYSALPVARIACQMFR